MPTGLQTTLELLTRTENDAAVRVLVPALDSPHPSIQLGALVALLRRNSPTGGREILKRMPQMNPEWRAIIRQYQGRMTRALRDAVLGTDLDLCENACNAAAWFHEYDLIPTLLNVLEDANHANCEMAARTVMELVHALYDELAGTGKPADRRDPQMVRRFVVGSLEHSVQRFAQHKRRETIEAFLLLVARDNVTLKQILQNPHHPAFLAVMETLGKSSERGVLRLLLSFLDDPHAPSAALSILSSRCDVRFIHHLLKKIGREPAVPVAQNLRRVESIAWLSKTALLEQIDDAGQHSVVRLVTASGVPRPQIYAAIEYLLRHGKPGGRREAARALASFHGADANALAMRALADPDPQVKANIVPQLRGRGITGVLPTLLELVESPYEVVRRAARESLTEFSFKRYLAAFDALDDEVRRSTGMLVKKVDPQTLAQVIEELKSPVRTRRLRGLTIARTIDLIAPLEDTLIELLGDEDHMVRFEAVTALGQINSPASREALHAALGDTSEVVRQAAQRSLQELLHAADLPAASPAGAPA